MPSPRLGRLVQSLPLHLSSIHRPSCRCTIPTSQARLRQPATLNRRPGKRTSMYSRNSITNSRCTTGRCLPSRPPSRASLSRSQRCIHIRTSTIRNKARIRVAPWVLLTATTRTVLFSRRLWTLASCAVTQMPPRPQVCGTRLRRLHNLSRCRSRNPSRKLRNSHRCSRSRARAEDLARPRTTRSPTLRTRNRCRLLFLSRRTHTPLLLRAHTRPRLRTATPHPRRCPRQCRATDTAIRIRHLMAMGTRL